MIGAPNAAERATMLTVLALAIIPRYMIVEVVMIRRQIWLYQLLPRLIPKRLFD